jgi:type IV pilus assembly protein PilO
MNLDAILIPLARLPWTLLAFGIAGWFAYDYYTFFNSADSPLQIEKNQIVELQSEVKAKAAKLQEVEQFRRTLDQRKQQLAEMVAQLNEKKSAVSEKFDAAEFINLVSTEARRVGLDVIRLEPQTTVTKELYAEHPFRLVFRGVYVQFLVFLERISSLQKIVRIDEFDVSPSKNAQPGKSLVELEGRMALKVYRYVNSEADAIPQQTSTSKQEPAETQSAPPAQVGEQQQ